LVRISISAGKGCRVAEKLAEIEGIRAEKG
jgi:hypothetical protein